MLAEREDDQQNSDLSRIGLFGNVLLTARCPAALINIAHVV